MSERSESARRDPHGERASEVRVLPALALRDRANDSGERERHPEVGGGPEPLAEDRHGHDRRHGGREAGERRGATRPQDNQRAEVIVVAEDEADQTARPEERHLRPRGPVRPRGAPGREEGESQEDQRDRDPQPVQDDRPHPQARGGEEVRAGRPAEGRTESR